MNDQNLSLIVLAETWNITNKYKGSIMMCMYIEWVQRKDTEGHTFNTALTSSQEVNGSAWAMAVEPE